ncbi:MAG TPA: xanthine dehydrogenase family protein subunit M [Pyrinomonadaceae bacterium]|jgi:CO/xanthine dehydrogenase FAD-binding subunit
MRAYIPDYELRTPSSLAEALGLLEREPGAWKPFAGGTDLMVLLEAGRLAHKRFFNIRGLAELGGIVETGDSITLGALTTYTQVQAHPTLRSEFPMLCRAASETGGLAIQNRGTLGGNIVNASPAADSPPALLVYDAELELISTRGSRRIPYADFHTGYKQMMLRPEELLARVHLPRRQGNWRDYYRKVGTRRAQAISKVCFAGAVLLEGDEVRDVRLALGSVAPTVVRCRKTEAVLRGRSLDSQALEAARDELANEIKPIDDIRSTAAYRLRVAQNLLTDFLWRREA